MAERPLKVWRGSMKGWKRFWYSIKGSRAQCRRRAVPNRQGDFQEFMVCMTFLEALRLRTPWAVEESWPSEVRGAFRFNRLKVADEPFRPV